MGTVIDIEKIEGFLDEVVVRLENGQEMIFYAAELDIVEEKNKTIRLSLLIKRYFFPVFLTSC